jgi:hypothetical protein
MLNIVSSFGIINEFKKSKYFNQNLGTVSTIDKNGKREFNNMDKFSHHYNSTYRTTIYGQGNIGNIKFYTDHYIRDYSFAVYYGENFEELILTFDHKIVKEKGIDSYLGYIIKRSEENYEDKIKKEELKKSEKKSLGDPDKVFKNPGAVTYADLKAYLDKKQKERYK